MITKWIKTGLLVLWAAFTLAACSDKEQEEGNVQPAEKTSCYVRGLLTTKGNVVRISQIASSPYGDYQFSYDAAGNLIRMWDNDVTPTPNGFKFLQDDVLYDVKLGSGRYVSTLDYDYELEWTYSCKYNEKGQVEMVKAEAVDEISQSEYIYHFKWNGNDELTEVRIEDASFLLSEDIVDDAINMTRMERTYTIQYSDVVNAVAQPTLAVSSLLPSQLNNLYLLGFLGESPKHFVKAITGTYKKGSESFNDRSEWSYTLNDDGTVRTETRVGHDTFHYTYQ